jgi:hypothetical protein
LASPTGDEGGPAGAAASAASQGGTNNEANIDSDHPATDGKAESAREVVQSEEEKKKDEEEAAPAPVPSPSSAAGNGSAIEMADVNHVRIVLPPRSDSHDGAFADEHKEVERKGSRAEVMIDVADGKMRQVNPSAHKVKSVSHWHDSRISVEMHLALYVRAHPHLTLLAPQAS